MLPSPRRLTAVAILLVAVLPLAVPGDPPAIRPDQAALHEGQTVRVEGVVADVLPRGSGSELIVARDGTAVPVRTDEAAPPLGAWISATGRLGRLGGRLVLWADEVAAAPSGAEPRLDWDALAQDPAAWTGRAVRLTGHLEGGRFTGDGHAIAVGEGSWTQGPVEAVGIVAYDAACLCYQFHAQRVQPWSR